MGLKKTDSSKDGLTETKPSKGTEPRVHSDLGKPVEPIESAEPETQAPESEALSHKPTFGESAEKPETTEPEGDPTTDADGKIDEAHKTQAAREELQSRVDEQANQPDPDRAQKDGAWPSTESLLAASVSRPHTIDPMTGHVIYSGEAAALPGGTVEHEMDGS